jgi:hypothetical protein
MRGKCMADAGKCAVNGRCGQARRASALLYFHRPLAWNRMSYVGSAIAILVCGGLGTAIAWFAVAPLGLDGIAAALTTAFAAMIAATLLFACGVALGRALQRFK